MTKIDPQKIGALRLAWSALTDTLTVEKSLVVKLFLLAVGFTLLEQGVPKIFPLPFVMETVWTVLITIASVVVSFFLPFGIIKKIILQSRGELWTDQELIRFTLRNARRWMELSFWSIFYYLKYPLLGLFSCGIAYILIGGMRIFSGFDLNAVIPHTTPILITLAVFFAIWGITRFPYLFATTYICIEQDLGTKESVIASYRLVHGRFWRTVWSFGVAGIMETFCVSFPLNILMAILSFWWFSQSGINLTTLIASFSGPNPTLPVALTLLSSLISDLSTAILQVNTALFGFFLYKTYSANSENRVESSASL